jgi:hypothetical protein
MHYKHLAAGAVVYAALLVAPSQGLAATPAQSGYSPPAGKVQQRIAQHQPPTNARAASSDPRALPFSGLDLGLMGAVGGILLALGVGIRRVVSSAAP